MPRRAVIILCDTSGARLGGLNTTRLIRGPDMKRTKSKDPPRRLNLKSMGEEHQAADDPPVAIKKRL